MNTSGATPSAGARVGAGLSAVGDVLGIYNGARRGGLTGYGGAALAGAGLANSASVAAGNGPLFNSDTNQALGAAGNVLGIYNGIKQGGVAGYGGAAVNTAALASSAGYGGAATTAVGGAALPLALFAAQYSLFNKESSYTPVDQYNDLKTQAAMYQDPQTIAKMKAAGQDPQAALDTVMGLMEQWNPQTQTFNQILSGPGTAGGRVANARQPF